MPTPAEVMFGEALAAARSGQRVRARDLLTRLIKMDPQNPEYWVWMSAVVATPRERVYCLKEALRLDPQNPTAQRGLTLIGAQPPNPDLVLPVSAQRRSWAAQFGLPGDETGARHPALGVRQYVLMGAAVLLLAAIGVFAIMGAKSRERQQAARPAYYIPSSTAEVATSATPQPAAQTGAATGPRAALLQHTYTPTPLYVNTPHSVSEAFRIGQRAFERGEWAAARGYFEQVLPMEPQAPDIHYYIAETYRQEGALKDALEAYDKAADDGFAPAFLGRARVILAQDPDAVEKALADLEAAVKHDPEFTEAYIALAELQIQAQDYTAALRTLDQAEDRLEPSALLHLYRAEVYLAGEKPRQALESARAANQMDPALLPAYRVLGAALQLSGDIEESIDPLSTYLYYTPRDAEAWAMLAEAQLVSGDAESARRALDQSLKLNSAQPEARMLRGSLLLQEGRAEDALKDFEAVLRADPDSFAAHMGAAEAVMELGYPGDAYTQIERAKRLAVSDAQKAEWLYLRGRSLDKLGETAVALKDYKALVALPHGVAEADWLAYARRRITALEKATATPTAKPRTP